MIRTRSFRIQSYGQRQERHYSIDPPKAENSGLDQLLNAMSVRQLLALNAYLDVAMRKRASHTQTGTLGASAIAPPPNPPSDRTAPNQERASSEGLGGDRGAATNAMPSNPQPKQQPPQQQPAPQQSNETQPQQPAAPRPQDQGEQQDSQPQGDKPVDSKVPESKPQEPVSVGGNILARIKALRDKDPDASRMWRETEKDGVSTAAHETVHALSRDELGGYLFPDGTRARRIESDFGRDSYLPEPKSLLNDFPKIPGMSDIYIHGDTGQPASSTKNFGFLLDELNAYNTESFLHMQGSISADDVNFTGTMMLGSGMMGYINRLTPEQRERLFKEHGDTLRKMWVFTRQAMAHGLGRLPSDKEEWFKAFLSNPENRKGIEQLMGRPENAPQGEQAKAEKQAGKPEKGETKDRKEARNPRGGVAWGHQFKSDLMKEFGLTDAQAAGIVGNLHAETGGFKHMQELRPLRGRGGAGVAQWTGPRRREMERLGFNLRTYEGNWKALKHDLHGKYKSTIAAIKKTKTSSQASAKFLEMFERPLHYNYGPRARAAKLYEKK